MRVVQINTSDTRGGAAIAAYRLHHALRKEGIDSRMFVRRKLSADHSVDTFDPPRDIRSKLYRFFRRQQIASTSDDRRSERRSGAGVFSDDRTTFGGQSAEAIPAADVINLHWISDFLDLRAAFSQTSVPVVWTLHDMNAFTGGCHYDAGCGRFVERCGACPQLQSAAENDWSRRIWKRKKEIYSRLAAGRLHVVALCEWMAREVRRSSLLGGFPVSVIPNSIDAETYQPRVTDGLRSALGIPESAPVILFLAHSIAERRKGFFLLSDALRGAELPSDTHLVSVGSSKPTIETAVSHVHLGRIENEPLLSLIYSMADVFVIPSIQDNLPNTVLEAMSCGTAVVGFDVGGISDMVESGRTGLLVGVNDVRALRTGIKRLVDDRVEAGRMGAAARERVRAHYAAEIQAGRYADLYRTLASEGSGVTAEEHHVVTMDAG